MKKTIIIKRIVLISLAVIALFAAMIATRLIVETYFSYNNPIFTGYGFHTSEDLQKITDRDMAAVTEILDDYHIPYKVRNDGRSIMVQGYKWDEAVMVMTNCCDLEFDGCLIT